MATIMKEDNEVVVYTKGSPEKIVSMCNLSSEDKYKIELEIFKSQEQAMRVIAFAHKVIKEVIDFKN